MLFCRRAAGSGGIPPGLDFSNLGDSELQNLLNSMNQQQLMQLFGGMKDLLSLFKNSDSMHPF
jgi:hypothetical protein